MSSRFAYERLRGSPGAWLRLTGVTIPEFDLLLEAMRSELEAARAERLSRESRRRRPGGGRREQLPLTERLLMALMWLDMYPNHEALAKMFGVSDSTVSRYLGHLVPKLRDHLNELGHPVAEDPGRKQRYDLDKLLEELPELRQYVASSDSASSRADRQTSKPQIRKLTLDK